MKDSIVEEVRKYRMEHTKKFGGDLHAICEDTTTKWRRSFYDKVIKNSARKITTP